jgi:hypothetical protein
MKNARNYQRRLNSSIKEEITYAKQLINAKDKKVIPVAKRIMKTIKKKPLETKEQVLSADNVLNQVYNHVLIPLIKAAGTWLVEGGVTTIIETASSYLAEIGMALATLVI